MSDRRLEARHLLIVLALLLTILLLIFGRVEASRDSAFADQLTAPSNDDFATATVLGSDSGTLDSETNVDATVEPGEPAHAGYGPERSVWYAWTPSVTGNALVDIDVGSCCTDDMVIGIYTGSSVEALTEVAAAGPSYTALHVEFPVSAASTYYLAVAGVNATDASKFDLAWDMGPANDYFAAATPLGSDSGSLDNETNVDASVEPGEPAHAGYGPARSVWYAWTPSVTGNALVDIDVGSCCIYDLVIGIYTGSSVETLTEATSAGPSYTALHVAFPVTAASTYYLVVAGVNATDASKFDLAWEAQPIPANDDFADATILPGDSGWLLAETNEWATAEPGEPSHNELPGTPARSVWYQWTAVADGPAVVTGNTLPYSSAIDIVMAAYTGSAVETLTEVAAWGGNGTHTVRLEFAVVAGTTYHIVLDGYDEDETGSFDLTWALSPPANDDFANATILVEDSGILTAESNEKATPQIGEPSHAGVAGTPARSIWYEWTPIWHGSATIDIDTPAAPDDWDTVGVVYTGSNLATLTEVVAASTVGDNLHLEFEVVAGTTYRLVVDGQDSNNWGVFDLTWENEPVSGNFIVTKTEDTDDGACDSDCSLREAVVAANATGGDDTIELPAGLYQLTLDTHLAADHYGSLDIEREAGTTSILGAGRETTIVDATTLRTLGLKNPDRVFTVGYHAGLKLVGVTVTGGYTASGGSTEIHGGGIWNWNGTLTVTDCVIEGNVAGGDGGGIANFYGFATISNTIIHDNNTDPPEYSATSSGGGIYNAGTMTITHSAIESNASDWGGGIASEYRYLEEYVPLLTIISSTINENTAQYGAGILNIEMMADEPGRETSMIISDTHITDNHADRWQGSTGAYNEGGGILNMGYSAAMTVTNSAISGNLVTAEHRWHPKDGSGGGILNHAGRAVVVGTTIAGNQTICDQGDPGDAMLCGRGGGIANVGAGRLSVTNSTLSGNESTLLNNEFNFYRGGGAGGGLAHMPHCESSYCWCPITYVVNTTITDNEADHGGGINTRWETCTGCIYDISEWEVEPYSNVYQCPGLFVSNSIVASNTVSVTSGTEDSWGEYTSVGYNLVGDGTGCPTDGPGDLTTVDPRLGPLADNGGSTWTHALLAGSQAIDTGDTGLTTDQRGVARPQGAADDIGAFEAIPGFNLPPELAAVGDQSVAEGATLEVGMSASDADGDPLSFSFSGEPIFAVLVDNEDGTATLSLTPGYDDAGVYPGVTITVSDSVAVDSETFTITVTNSNRVPAADDQLVTTVQDTPVNVTLTGLDPDGDVLTFTIDRPPDNGVLSGTAPYLTYSPKSGYSGADSFTFTVSDGDLTSPAATVSISVTTPASNTAPVLDPVGDQLVAEGGTLEVIISASDLDSDPLTFSLSGEPACAFLVDHGDGTATLTLAPGFADAGVYAGVTITVSDGVDTDSETFTIRVKETLLLFLPLVLLGH